VYALRPPALDDLGLVPAIQTHVAQQTRPLKNLNVSVETPTQGLPPLSAAIELATYRITLEALTNVINHAQARNCTISLSVSEGRYRRLNLEIVDDGEGLSENHQAGVGLTSMRGDLLAKLGRFDEARAELERAATLTRNARERELLIARAREAGLH